HFYRSFGRLPSLAGYLGIASGTLGFLAIPWIMPATFYIIVMQGWCAAAIVFGVLVLQARGRVVNFAPAILLGGASYSLYLVHPFAMMPVRIFATRLGLLTRAPLVPVFAVATAAMVAAGLLVYRYAELPLTNAVRRRLQVRG